MGQMEQVARRPVTATIAATVALLVVQALAVSSLPLGEVAGHAVGHLGVALPFVLATVVVVSVWPTPPPTRLGRSGRRTLLVGLVAVGGGGLLEGLGALGYRPLSPSSALQSLHDVGVLVTIAGMPVLLVGGVASLLATAFHEGWVRRPWFWIVAAGVATLIGAYLAGAMIFGFY